jgi:methylase of polypeptide subunit release factors
MFEVGVGQAGAVAALLAAQGLESAAPRRDLNGVERVAMAWRPV